MIKKTTASIKGRSFGIGKRSISVILALLLVVGTFAVIPFFTQAGDSTTTVFSILAEAVGTEKPTEKYWSYNIHEYSEKPSFVTSDKNFKAPDVGFTDDGIAVISWETYSGADGYTVNIYDSSNTLVLSEKTTAVTYNVPDGIFTQGAEYQLQIVAASGNDTVAGSMIRPYKYSAHVEFADIATNLNGKNMRDSAAADDAVFERTPDGVDSLAVKALAVQDSFYYTNISKLPSDTQAVAYWIGQTKSTDGSYYSLNFRHDRFPAKPTSSGICYYVPTNGDPVHTGGFQTNSYQSYTDNKHGDFVEGWVVIPLSSFGDSGKQAFLDAASLDLQLPWAQYKNLISSDGARLSNGNLRNTDINVYCSNIFAIAFTAPLDGYYTLGKFGIINYGEYTTNFKYRITVNESTVWPSSGWCVYTDSASADVGYQGLSLELSADDVVRFEVAATDAFDEIETNARYRVKWMISINYSQWEQMYNSSDDIYNMLALDMVDYFKALAAESGQFDIDYDKHYAESLLRGNETDDDDSNQNDAVPDNSGGNTDSENGKWIEGTEDEVIYTPGIIRKQIKKFTTVEYPVLMIVLICVAAVLVIATIVIIIILHKKGKIHWFKKKSKTSKNK